jgi:type I restriction enzyme R subunit
MSFDKKAAAELKRSERNYVEKPLLDQLDKLGWEIIDLDRDQKPHHSQRQTFTEVVLYPVLRQKLKDINPWLEDDQADEAIKHLTAQLPSTQLIPNNQHVLRLLLENTSVSENRKTQDRNPTVRFVDFKHPDKNSYIAICQFKVRIIGTEQHIYPDIVCFLNGIPVAVIECKSPKVKEPIPEAIDQLMRYSQQRGAKGEGSPELFYFNQFIVATCRQQAKFGTITTRNERHFYRWADPYPLSIHDLEPGSSSPDDQKRLVAGMFARQNLLDILRCFTIFSTNDKGKTIKVVGRYQQFRAVKCAVKRLLEGKTPRERSGVIWHTQGSGKSLTMMFMVREMYRHTALAKWKIVFLTDRTQLEQQLRETSANIGFTVKVAHSIAKVKELIKSDTSDLIMAMIHKFQERELREVFPILNTSPHILTMTDEAHRSQYSQLGANLDNAMPNASRIAFTGTPIEKTTKVYGSNIDTYSMRQAIEDGVTLEIVYEGRTHQAEVSDREGMDAAFIDVFSDYNLYERLQILGYGTKDAYMEAESTIEAKARDMVAHYVEFVFPNGFKGQVVASSREAAVLYKKYIDQALAEKHAALLQAYAENLDLEQLQKIQTDVIISGNHNDLPDLKVYSNKTKHEETIRSFKLPYGEAHQGTTGDMGIIIVNNMLLTGFDAPIEQVMYLDKITKAHSLLQAIARVNRVYEGKAKGFVVDYVGIGHHLKEAIDIYTDREQQEILGCISSAEEEIRDLHAAHGEMMAFLAQHGLQDFSDHDAFLERFYDEDIRFAFMLALRKFTRCLNLVFPAKEALAYVKDYQMLMEINVIAQRHFYDSRMSMRDVPQKLRAIADQYLESRGIDVKVAPISILDDDFEKVVGKRRRVKTRAAASEHAIRHHLAFDFGDDPELQASFAEALELIFEKFRNNWDKIAEELEKLRQRMREADKEPRYGLHPMKQIPFFRMLKREIYQEEVVEEDRVLQLVELTRLIYDEIQRELKLVGFWESEQARNQLKSKIQSILLGARYHKVPGILRNWENIITRTMEIAHNNQDSILYAPW